MYREESVGRGWAVDKGFARADPRRSSAEAVVNADASPHRQRRHVDSRGHGVGRDVAVRSPAQGFAKIVGCLRRLRRAEAGLAQRVMGPGMTADAVDLEVVMLDRVRRVECRQRERRCSIPARPCDK